MDNRYTLSDQSISMLLQLLQLGILTGTDVSDHFRTFKMISEGSTLYPDPDFESQFQENLQRLRDQPVQVNPNVD